MKKQNKGFTLIELVVVMAIIAVLAVMIVAAISAARRQSVDTQRTGNLKTLEVALESYATTHSNKYPTSADIAALVTDLKAAGSLTQDVAATTADYAYKTGDSGQTYMMVACKVGNTAGPTIAYATGVYTSGGCTGSSVGYTAQR